MSYTLFLDDERSPSQVTWAVFPRNNLSIVRNYDQFVTHIKQHGLPGFVCFDHDLADEHYAAMLKENESSDNKFTIWMPDDDLSDGLNITFDYGNEKTGYDCAKWLVDYCEDNGYKFPQFVVHSMNPAGKVRIEQYIANAQKHLNI
jgi:hypothetical protein